MQSLEKWRLILGKQADSENEIALSDEQRGMDNTLEAIYDSERRGGLGASSPNINRWLGDIRRYFPTPVVQMIQKDALNRLGLTQLLLEPELLESIEPDVQLAATLLSLNKVIPEKTRETAKNVVRKIVDNIEKKLRLPLLQAVKGALNKSEKNRRPKLNEIDWHSTIKRNLKHYQPDYQTIIPHELVGFGKKGHSLRHIILLVDQSGSMATSVVYSAVAASVLGSLRSVETNLVLFDTAVVDMSEKIHDPVEILFGSQLGGGTDINKALAYAETIIHRPKDTILVLISDLFEGGNEADMIRRAASLKNDGVQVISLLALNDEGKPSYHHKIAEVFGELEIPTFGCSPQFFPEMMAAAINREKIKNAPI